MPPRDDVAGPRSPLNGSAGEHCRSLDARRFDPNTAARLFKMPLAKKWHLLRGDQLLQPSRCWRPRRLVGSRSRTVRVCRPRTRQRARSPGRKGRSTEDPDPELAAQRRFYNDAFIAPDPIWGTLRFEADLGVERYLAGEDM
jgi:hypothetical protein